LCLQKDVSATSKFKKAEKEEEMTKCFGLAADLSLLYMQKLEEELTGTTTNTGTHSPQPPAAHKSLGVILEQALQEGPALLLHRGKPDEALERYRASLSAVETQGANAIRLKFMCQVAELILQGLVGEKYKAPASSPPKITNWKPKYYASLNQVNKSALVILIFKF
jgi:hypothetical protein